MQCHSIFYIMSYIKIVREKLVNLEYTLNKELIRANGAGAYASTTLSGCNTRKYHGLLVVPFKDNTTHVLLANMSETVIQHDKKFHLGIYKFPVGVFNPQGHKYFREFESDPIPTKIYRVGGVVLKKEMLLVQNETQMLLRYTLLEASSATKLQLQPSLAFRNIHNLRRASMEANTKAATVKNGIKVKLYAEYPNLYMQTSRKAKYVTAPDWMYNVEYQEEQNRGYEYSEDLFVPGYFEVDMKKGQSVIISASLKEIAPNGLSRKFNAEIKNRIPRNTFENNLYNSAQQFFIKNKKDTFIRAGFHWYGFEFRDALIALPGLTLSQNNTKLFEDGLDTILRYFYKAKNEISSDIPLFLIRVIQQYFDSSNNQKAVWEKYGKDVLKIIKAITDNKYKTKVQENGLLYIPENYPTESWMNETIDGNAVTLRTGYLVDINALWYNAVMFASASAKIYKDTKLAKLIKNIEPKIASAFCDVFENDRGRHLSDFVNNEGVTTDSRPNQIFAVALPYSPLSDKKKQLVIESIEDHLLTERGLRSLSPRNKKFQEMKCSSEYDRKTTRHQGAVYPWLFGLYAEAKLRMYGKSALYNIEKRYKDFEPVMHTNGIGTVSEYYSPNPPYRGGGAISYAPSVGELLRVKMMLEEYSEKV